MNKNIIVTGCAGFIGSNLVDRLLSMGHDVIGIDNFSTGQKRFLHSALAHDRFKLVEMDLLDLSKETILFKNAQRVFHLAANADVRFGTKHPGKDLEQNTMVTYQVLEAMRAHDVRQIVFSSTGSIYGDTDIIPTPETAPFPTQTSLYGASKLACEGLIAAYCEGFNFQSWIFRFVSILGERYTHGHLYDFYKQLRNQQSNLTVLGNGLQRKSYLHVQDCIDAILIVTQKAKDKVNIFNLGTNEYCLVNDSISLLCNLMNIKPEIHYTGGDRGWVGDNPFLFLDTNKIQSLGWRPKYSIDEGVKTTVQFLQNNEWVFDVRA